MTDLNYIGITCTKVSKTLISQIKETNELSQGLFTFNYHPARCDINRHPVGSAVVVRTFMRLCVLPDAAL